ncbi:uncharacterized protein LOC112460468 [Temnothorax curvispinosus]|uniref:Uncharacterized protein LOC112460468 n=2 Tax=Temnothorax TaxID=300110 RepID=A0A6J1QGH1_9HYME|nr:uncharacterized protein LOC112460468 [Temnothorax curvispinosus]TGZ45864.1 Uncharacterized protein DBV15_06491 [Temnothorax longispinosus]
MFVRDAFCALCTVLLCLNVNVAEWVDMPQFSDETKIYRIPSVQHDQFYKFRRGDADSINFPNGQRNGSQTYRYPAEATRVTHNKRMEIKRINSIAMSTTPANLFPDQIADSFADTGTSRTTIITDTVTENKLNNKDDATISPIEDTMINTLTTQPSPNNKQETSRDKYDNDTSQQDDGIFQYLPIDLLKSVHRTLQSQPGSIEGKLYFLKTFEKTLMSEIESRLTTSMAPSRKIRGADYHDDHDDHSLGFPSTEGTLMAISFLTFAVYLVRLVMLLLRNMNMPTTTTTAATVFLGKRKRSTDLDDDTARILSNINSFVPDF